FETGRGPVEEILVTRQIRHHRPVVSYLPGDQVDQPARNVLGGPRRGAPAGGHAVRRRPG
ncbi:hypothetical protein, partial [Streptomyces sp. NPDC005302]|uniref:hypothetical protein n=1 Tax=Streptomyces sp. NPDC005302 TaxID=3154675 RepID=UPI0033B2ADAB